MSIAGYTPTPVPAACLDSGTIETWLQNANVLANCATTVPSSVTCQPVNGALSGGCITVRPSVAGVNPTDPAAVAIDKKVVLGFVQISIPPVTENRDRQGENETYQRPGSGYFRASLQCDGQTIATGPTVLLNTSGSVPLNLVGCCPSSSEVSVCVEQVGIQADPYTGNVCGAMLCFTDGYQRSLQEAEGFCCAPALGGCNVGRAGLHLLQQNFAAVHALASQGYQLVECVSAVQFTGAGSQGLHTAGGDIEYLVVGGATVCWQAFNNLEISMTGGPSVNCGAGSTNCPLTRIVPEIISTDVTGLRTGCFEFPIVACGSCSIGDVISAGFGDLATVCDDTADPTVNLQGAQVVSIDQQYTVFTFRRVDPIAEGLLPSRVTALLEKCIRRSQVELLIAQMDALSTYLATVVDNTFYCNITSGSVAGPNPQTGTQVIRPPFPPPPTGPVPNKKTFVAGSVTVCFDVPAAQYYQNFDVDLTITCGGDTFTQSSVGAFGPSIIYSGQDEYTNNGPYTYCLQLPVSYTFNCLSTDSVDMTLTTGGAAALNVNANWNFLAVCL